MTSQQVSLGRDANGFLFVPESESVAGAIIILHERYGLVKHTLDLAQKLADDGFVALAPDLFSRWQGDKEALNRGDIHVDLPDSEIADIVGHGIEYLTTHPRVDPKRLAVMGVCQSGRYPIVVASQRDDIAALVVFYGAAQDSDWEVHELQPHSMPDMIGRLQAPTLFVFGEADHVISVDDVIRIKTTYEHARKSYRMRLFPNMPHGWLNDTMPGRYRPQEAREAWQLLLGYLADVFDSNWPPQGRVVWELQSDISQTYDFSKNVRLA